MAIALAVAGPVARPDVRRATGRDGRRAPCSPRSTPLGPAAAGPARRGWSTWPRRPCRWASSPPSGPIRRALIDETDDPSAVGGVLWVLWLAVAALVPAAWPSGPRPSFDLFLLVPLNLLAARAIADLANRRIPVRTLTWLAPATAVCVAWWASANLRKAVADLARGRGSTPATALGLHLALDLLVVAVLITRAPRPLGPPPRRPPAPGPGRVPRPPCSP